MATAVQVSMLDYLATTYEPDCEFVDGELVERHVGTWDHGRTQAVLGAMLAAYEADLPVMVATEWRARVSATRVRIPDLTLVRSGRQEAVLAEAPLLTVEVISPEDTWAATRRKCEEYAALGVRTMWIVDPGRRRAEVWAGGVWSAAEVLTVVGTPVRVELKAVWERLQG